MPKRLTAPQIPSKEFAKFVEEFCPDPSKGPAPTLAQRVGASPDLRCRMDRFRAGKFIDENVAAGVAH